MESAAASTVSRELEGMLVPWLTRDAWLWPGALVGRRLDVPIAVDSTAETARRGVSIFAA